METDIVIAETLLDLAEESPENFLAHILCLGGECTLVFNDRKYVLSEGSLMIVMKGSGIRDVRHSEDFRVKVLYAAMSLIKSSTPQSNYGMKGLFSLISEPVMQLTDSQRRLCEYDLDAIAMRLGNSTHNFYPEMVRNVLQTALLDFFDFHARIYGVGPISIQKASILERFFHMLDAGTFQKHRELVYYADRLCVTPKYLSETSRKLSGRTATYWINQYTALALARALRDRTLTFKDISEQFGFSSPSHFTLYVRRQLGVPPSSYRFGETDS